MKNNSIMELAASTKLPMRVLVMAEDIEPLTKAIEMGYVVCDGNGGATWMLGSKTLLAYFLGRVWASDFPNVKRGGGTPVWTKGEGVFQDLSYRAVTIAYLKAMVLYIAHGMQWSKEIEKFAEWSLDYDLWCKCHYFGDDMSDEKQKEHVEHKRGRQNMLELLPDTFTEKDVVEVRQRLGLDGDAKNMLRVWVYRKYILKDKETGEFRKN